MKVKRKLGEEVIVLVKALTSHFCVLGSSPRLTIILVRGSQAAQTQDKRQTPRT